MTLPELLIAVTVMGLIAVVLSSTIIVTLRQQDSTVGRFNVARAEQQVGMWLPGDLSSAAAVSTLPGASPCAVRAEGAEFVASGAACPDLGLQPGSNALLIGWAEKDENDVVTYTNVSYYFAPVGDGSGFALTRIECVGSGSWTCTTQTILSDLPGPPPGVDWDPGSTRPDWVILVSEPLAANAVDESDVVSGSENFKNARRVVVTINGGGSSDGAGGGTNHISITAGGTYRNEIDGTSIQGAPSFTEARSLCGGPVTLIVDESNSVGTANAGNHVKNGVRDFVTALVGTPVRIQVVGFHTFSHTLGTSDWHKYYDMTNEADVNALLNSIDDLRFSWTGGTNGGTNWEEAFFRTFNTSSGATPDVLPDKVVFFTDGIPTFDRLVHRTGDLPALPPDPGPAWPDSTGYEYSQVAFDRANFIATRHRSTTELIGVAVGAATTTSSNWITNPGAGYRLGWERGSYRYVHDISTYYLRYQKKDSSNGAWYWVNWSTWNSAATNRRQDLGWTSVPYATYQTVENPPNTNNNTGSGNDGARYTTTATPVSTAEYNANSSNPAYRSVSKTWSSSGPDWEPVSPPSDPSNPPTGYRSFQVWEPPYEAYTAPTTASVRNDRIIGRLIAGGDNYVEAVIAGGQYSNVKTANLYSTTNWSLLPTALKAIALGECGGSLTLQTRLNGSPASDPFSYQNTKQFDHTGAELTIEQKVVTTNRVQPARTFDLDITSGVHRDVVIVPQHLSDLAGYNPAGWTCRAGMTDRPFELVDVPDSPWKGIKVRVGANEAVSCIQAVTR